MTQRARGWWVGGGLWLAAMGCSAVNPAYDDSSGAADTVPSDSESPVPTTEGPEPTTVGATSGEGTGSSGSVDTGVFDTGPGPQDTGVVGSCEPENPGRPLDIRIYDVNTDGCADLVLQGALVDLARLPGTDHYVGRLCDAQCGGLCSTLPGGDRFLRIELPAEIGSAMAEASCVSLDASVDGDDECRVDHIAAWYDSSGQSKLPDLVGVSEDANPRLFATDVLPDFGWASLEPCDGGCDDGSDVEPGLWAIKISPNGTLFAHGESGEAELTFSGGAQSGRYMLTNLRSYVSAQVCELQAAWVALAI